MFKNMQLIILFDMFLSLINFDMFVLTCLSIRKRLLHSAINKRNKELQHVSKELNQSETFLSKHLSNIDFYILNGSITSYNKKSLQKSLNTQQKKTIFTDEKLHITNIHS